jgi:hypothetical protein
MLATGALLLPVSAVAMIGVGSASAARVSPAGSGPVKCTGIKGSISFVPPLTNSGTAPETTTEVVITITKCKNQPGATGAAPKKGTVHENIVAPGATDSCGSLEGTGPPTPETLTVNWKNGDGSSTSSYSGYTVSANGAGDEGFVLPNTGGTGSTSGSYAQASGSTAAAYSNLTASQLAADCAGAGIKKLTIKSGSSLL